MSPRDALQTAPGPNGAARAPRGWVRVAALAVLTAVALYLCARIVYPFLPGVTWAVALAAVSLPLHRWVRRHVGNENWAAGLSTAAVVLVLVVPIVLVGWQLAHEAQAGGQRLKDQAAGQWRETAARVPYVGGWIGELDRHIDFENEARNLVARLGQTSLGLIENTLAGVLQALVAVFILFFCLRDRHRLLDQIRQLVPLDPADTDRVIDRADDAIHATVYGTILTAVIQGVTGGLLFWALGLPAPVLWGVVMTVLGILPFVGAFLVWVPFAVVLATEDRWAAAAALAGWGLLMAGPVCNYLYACAAGGRMRMHPAPTLLAFIGGLAVFGISGMILGPIVLAVTAAVLDAWRHHVMRGRPAEDVIAPAGVR
jgi:predicted PurR-regulated permease PerM